jgi:hypothetical protein
MNKKNLCLNLFLDFLYCPQMDVDGITYFHNFPRIIQDYSGKMRSLTK